MSVSVRVSERMYVYGIVRESYCEVIGFRFGRRCLRFRYGLCGRGRRRLRRGFAAPSRLYCVSIAVKFVSLSLFLFLRADPLSAAGRTPYTHEHASKHA